MKFLITNDDGYDGPGLAALFQALTPLGEVKVTAPAVCQSAKGHAVNMRDGLKVEHRTVTPFGKMNIVHGSPADCVRVGMMGPNGFQPDYVIAGINTGANLGIDMFYSGTAAAAREAAIMQVPSLAISRYIQPGVDIHWDNMIPHVTRLVKTLTTGSQKLPAGQFWNVNLPSVPNDDHLPAIKITKHGLLSHQLSFSTLESNDDTTVLQYEGNFRERGKSQSCDVKTLFDGHITATPVDLCTTAPSDLIGQQIALND